MFPMKTLHEESEQADEETLRQNCFAPVQLLHAVQQHDLLAIERMLKASNEVVHFSYGPLQTTLTQIVCTLTENKALPLLKILISHGADVTSQDKLGRTSLHYAASNGHVELVRLLLQHGADVNVKFQVNRRTDSEPTTAGDFGLLKSLPLPECWGRTPLHQAVKQNHIEVVQLLLNHGASVNIQDEHGITPLLLAGAGMRSSTLECYERIVDLLVDNYADVNVCSTFTGTTPLHHSVSLNSYTATKRLLEAGAVIKEGSCGQTPLHEAAGKGLTAILSLLLRHESTSLNRPDNDGRTALHKAAFAGSRECVLELLEHGGELSAETKTHISVIEVIFSHVPRPVNLLTDVFNSKITCNDVSINDVDFKVTLDYNVLASHGREKQMSVITAIINTTRRIQNFQLLQHPLVESFLCLKWNSLRIFFYIWVLTHLFFAISLSLYVLLIVHESGETSAWIPVSRIALLVSSSFLLMHGLIQCALIPKHYFKQYEVWLNLICVFISVVVAVFGEGMPTKELFSLKRNPSDMETNDRIEPVPWVLHATSIAILLAWLELMFLIGRFPSFGYYALMFSTVLQNVIKVLLTFICLIIGFALSFAVQFHLSEQFQTPWRAMVKTTVMLMGEYEYDDLFKNNQTEPSVRLPGTSRVIFMLFIILSSIVLMNLMVGLAVSDIQGLQTEGHVKRLAKQATFLSHVETVLTHKFLRSEYFPKWMYRCLYYNRSVDTTLVIKPAQAYIHKYVETKKNIRIPHLLVESIVKISLENKKNKHGEDNVDNKSIIEILRQVQEELKELRHKLCPNQEPVEN